MSTEEGFVLVNLDEGFKAIDIDLISQKAVKNFSFIIDDPEFRADFKLADFETLYAAEDMVNIEDERMPYTSSKRCSAYFSRTPFSCYWF